MSTPDHRTPARKIAGALGAGTLIGYMLPGLAGAWPAIRGPFGVEDRTASGRGFALTFDDGPHAQGTPAVLEILSRENVQATFFLVGEQLLRNHGLGREIVDRGHEVALHCHRHRNLLRLGPSQVRDDIARAQAIIEDHTGRSPQLYRPPYGVLNAAALCIARQRGWRTMLWSEWGRDWEARATPGSIAERVSASAEEGAVLLLHDADDYSSPSSWRRTAAALPLVLHTLAERGLEPTAL
ncbi:MAG TPA: polysaccharide deacetylase family protein [Solirubrobacteraceae bacterium]|nr:polysaccharide deacetylase family protein [Solirubrobacteraceae bacterium]